MVTMGLQWDPQPGGSSRGLLHQEMNGQAKLKEGIAITKWPLLVLRAQTAPVDLQEFRTPAHTNISSTCMPSCLFANRLQVAGKKVCLQAARSESNACLPDHTSKWVCPKNTASNMEGLRGPSLNLVLYKLKCSKMHTCF
eukprot:1158159-Pelagomonas_calceolata.AAC.1